ncbi:hypothetical protein V8F06_014644, partial [Rhypophila decipiens]
LRRFLGGKGLVLSSTIGNNGKTLSVKANLPDTGAAGYLFINRKLARKAKELLNAQTRADTLQKGRIEGYKGGDQQIIDTMIRLDLYVQGRVIRDEWFMIVDMKKDIILGKQWLAHHDILVDSRRNRLLFPVDWELAPKTQMEGNISMDRSPYPMKTDSRHQEDMERREREMDKRDREIRNGREERE